MAVKMKNIIINKIIIGLEVHIELKTQSKMFCPCRADHFAKEPNTQTCPTCLGLPGALPYPNRKAIEDTVLLGLALNCNIPLNSRFDRKNYFYPDLPKGYQISQYLQPLAENGYLPLSGGLKIAIRRVHLEEDTAKLIHQTLDQNHVSLIDFNRSGVPLVEIVTEPVIFSSDDAKDYLQSLQQLVRSLNIADADMEKGSMRCEPNVNLELTAGSKVVFTPIAEIKNINSFRFVKKAIDYEVKRQFQAYLENQEERNDHNKQTRGWDEKKNVTVLQRKKEEAQDYRYFPEPDIPPIEWSKDDLTGFSKQLNHFVLPWQKMKKLVSEYSLSEYQAKVLNADEEKYQFFEKCIQIGGVAMAQSLANAVINKRYSEGLSPQEVIDQLSGENKTKPVSEEHIKQLVKELLKLHPEAIAGYKTGKIQALGLIVGLVKKETGVIVSINDIAKLIDCEGHE